MLKFSLKQSVEIKFCSFKDESGSDSDGDESTSSSYSSLSDFVSEMVSSDLSPSKDIVKFIKILLIRFFFNSKYFYFQLFNQVFHI